MNYSADETLILLFFHAGATEQTKLEQLCGTQ